MELSVCVLSVPQLALKFGADRDTGEMLAILTPVVAFFVRLFIGLRKLSRNHCGATLRFFQFTVFFLAAILLVCIDSLMILSMEMNDGALWAHPGDMMVMLVLLAIYFSAMLFPFTRAGLLGRQPELLPIRTSGDRWYHDSTTDQR